MATTLRDLIRDDINECLPDVPEDEKVVLLDEIMETISEKLNSVIDNN